MKTGTIIFIIVVLAMIGILLALYFYGKKLEKTQAGQEETVKLWYAYNTENLMKDLEYPELIAERDSTLRMHCLKNDVEKARRKV